MLLQQTIPSFPLFPSIALITIRTNALRLENGHPKLHVITAIVHKTFAAVGSHSFMFSCRFPGLNS